MSDRKSFIDSPIAKWILAIATIVSMSWGLFQTFHVKNPKLQYEVLSQARLFNKTEDLSSFKLFMDTIDVLKGNQNISFYVIKIQNVGSQHLRRNDYDDGSFGFMVNDGTILQKVDFVESSAQNIEDSYKECQSSSTEKFISIPKITLDRKEWYTISFSIIHNDDSIPSFHPVGKIVGQKEITVIPYSQETNQTSFREKVLFGGLGVNVVRAIVFLLIWIVIIIIIAIIGSGISDGIDNRRRERVSKLIVQNADFPSFIRDDYLRNNLSNIRVANHYYELGDEQLNKKYKDAIRKITSIENVYSKEFDVYKSMYNDIDRLIESGYLLKDTKGALFIPRDGREAVSKIIEILKNNRVDYRLLNARMPSAFYGGDIRSNIHTA